MKAITVFSHAVLAMTFLAGCGSGSSSGDRVPVNPTANAMRDCGPAFPEGAEPDQDSIENLFGCVTLSYVSSDGENTFEDTVVFTAEDERNTVLGGRSVGAVDGIRVFSCVELTFGDDDFLCLSSIGLGSENKYLFTMNSQFEGTGTHQLCFEADMCGLDGVEFPITAATISIVRGQTIATGGLSMNGMPITETEASDFMWSDAMQFGTSK